MRTPIGCVSSLGSGDRKQIAKMLNKGRNSARVLRRALILRQLGQGKGLFDECDQSMAPRPRAREKSFIVTSPGESS